VVPTSARSRQGVPDLLQAISEVATGQFICRPYRLKNEPPALRNALKELVEQLEAAYPGLPNARWVALRLLDGDQRIVEAIERGELGDLSRNDPGQNMGNLAWQLQEVQHA
jgi:Fe2+ transport system protein B